MMHTGNVARTGGHPTLNSRTCGGTTYCTHLWSTNVTCTLAYAPSSPSTPRVGVRVNHGEATPLECMLHPQHLVCHFKWKLSYGASCGASHCVYLGFTVHT